MHWWLSFFFIYYTCILEVLKVYGISPPLPSFPSPKIKTSSNLNPCKVCQNFVESFNKGMKNTARGKHEGGDAEWEESRLGSYADSEVRLVEIQENLCSDVKIGEDDCHNMAEQHESVLEDWWFHHKQSIALFQYFCIDNVKVCCPYNHYGPTCEPCNGGIENPCNGRGECDGNGTRFGNGKCKCHEGYQGDLCDQCTTGYYRDADKLECIECHVSCKQHCRGPGPLGCEMCKEGYHHETNSGCTDDNECVSAPCNSGEFCVNTDGSYNCKLCDMACDTCTGEGPDKCEKCSQDYEMTDGTCVEKAKDDAAITDSLEEETTEESDGHNEL
ncbi:cysteine-rich with EGF-like domain protein 1 isoform X3 [Centruroides sculpturatus]|nr:cysteine-rich with EGF-like domain protein 1 isoform X3 [Centruroides sculpturatus]